MKYTPPPFICPFVDTADMEMAVRNVTTLAMVMRARPCRMPAWPMTQVRRRKSMTPQMLRRQGISTPSFHDSFIDVTGLCDGASSPPPPPPDISKISPLLPVMEKS